MVKFSEHRKFQRGGTVESTTAAQRPSSIGTVTTQSLLASIKPEPVRAETEYGCVDWYPFVMPANTRTDWFDYDSGLAAG
jgi:hypothetical protein